MFARTKLSGRIASTEAESLERCQMGTTVFSHMRDLDFLFIGLRSAKIDIFYLKSVQLIPIIPTV